MNSTPKNDKRHARSQVPPAWAGKRLLDFLTSRFSYHDAQKWQQLIADGRIRVNGATVGASQVVSSGDAVEYRVPDLPEPAVDMTVSIIYENSELLVLNKSGNLPMHPAGKFFRHTLWGWLKAKFPRETFHFVNRLDRETSGLVLAARSAQACALYSQALQAAGSRKEYLAIVEGAFPDNWTAWGWLGKHGESVIRKKKRFLSAMSAEPADLPEGYQPVGTLFSRVCGNGPISLVHARLETGRTHQIRASLEAGGFPLVGDKMYGVDETAFLRFIAGEMTADDDRRMRLPRQALHAFRMILKHPQTGDIFKWEVPLPKDMADILALNDLGFEVF